MEKLEDLIIATLKDLIGLKCVRDANSETKNKLIYPTKRCDTIRISEQEARFLFVRHVDLSTEYFYSIEAPTTNMYCFKGASARSGNVDVCLYDEKLKRKHLIEFKALNPIQASFSKDFEKLLCDEDNLNNYFVHILKNTDKGTLPSIKEKYKKAIENSTEKYKTFNSRLRIFVCVIEKKSITKYEVNESGDLSEPIKVL